MQWHNATLQWHNSTEISLLLSSCSLLHCLAQLRFTVQFSHEPRPELVGQGSPPRVERVVLGVVGEIRDPGGVDVGEAEEAAGEVGRVLVGAEDGAEVGVALVSQRYPGRRGYKLRTS